MKIVGVVTLKGGAGKTSLAVNLACTVATWWGVETRLIDFDPQRTATDWAESLAPGKGICSNYIFNGKYTRGFNMREDVIPVESTCEDLKTALKGLPSKVELVIVDTPARVDKPSLWVAALADMILVPIEPEIGSVRAAAKTIILLREMQRSRKGSPEILIIPNKIDKSKMASFVQKEMSGLGNVGPAIPDSKATRSAALSGATIYDSANGRKFAENLFELGAIVIGAER